MSMTPLRSLIFAAVSGDSIDCSQFRLLKISTDDADQRGGDINKGDLSLTPLRSLIITAVSGKSIDCF